MGGGGSTGLRIIPKKQFFFIVSLLPDFPHETSQVLRGEISSDLYRLSWCDILNLTFCRLDFHQLLIKISYANVLT